MKYLLLYALLFVVLTSCSENTKENLNDISLGNSSFSTIKIGNQTWMQVNLHPSFHKGEGLIFIDSYDKDKILYTDKSYCYPNYENVEKYGALYTWEAAKNACPDGYRLPTDEDWQMLIDNIGDDAGLKLKSAEDWNGNNLSGMNMLPAGYNAFSKGSHGLWWSATSDDNENVWGRMLITYLTDATGTPIPDSEVLYRKSIRKNYCLSVRCIKK